MIQKNYYLASDLVDQLQQVYEMFCAKENIKNNKRMKYFLQENFKHSLQKYMVRKVKNFNY